IGRGKLLYVPLVAAKIRDRCGVSTLREQATASLAQWPVRIIANLATCDVGYGFIQQAGKGAKQTAFGLAAKSKQNQVLPGKNRVHDLRNHRVFVAHDAGEQRLPAL